ncbi:hypothetical protein Goklo_017037 [Gossypium klotzschianum]|uniref:Uncharacterized protein n=1 Tax=Gossypium klotzschianum TaxID=34286 RepID=A0A7J8UGS8_9ROSI|nr:hypothetical protein [Gossypium klotzschianum]
MIHISYLNHPLFEGLLNLAEAPFPSAMEVTYLGDEPC